MLVTLDNLESLLSALEQSDSLEGMQRVIEALPGRLRHAGAARREQHGSGAEGERIQRGGASQLR